MNNEQFRKFIAKQSATKPQDGASTSAGAKPAPTTALGSRLKASIPMTPRAVKGSSVQSEFARQMAQRNAPQDSKSTKTKLSVPKGTKLAAGYTDRSKQARYDEESDEKAKRIKALEESLKLGQIDEETFSKMRDEITGGELGATHLVKGLDRKLLERIRRGEDPNSTPTEDTTTTEAPRDVDDELDDLEKTEVTAVTHEAKVKQGQIAPKKLSRNEILKQFKAERAAAKAAAQPAPREMGSGFRKVGQRIQEGVRIEIDSEGREVLIVTDKDGNVKRKVRKGQAPAMPEVDPEAEKLGMAVEGEEEAPQVPLDRESDDDIFEGVPEYDPLAGLDDSEDEDAPPKQESAARKSRSRTTSPQRSASPHSPKVKPGDNKAQPPRRNYFNDTAPPTESLLTAPTFDPSVFANLAAKADRIDPSRFDPSTSSTTQDDEATRLKRKAAMLAGRDRDLDDIDMGFGASRGDDADEMEQEEGGGKRSKLSEWRGLKADDDEEDEDEGGEGKGKGGVKRKRGGGKKKGDKNSVSDVLRVMEAQKGR